MQVILDIYRFLFARKYFYKLNLHIYKLSLRGLGILNSENPHISGEDYFYKYIKNNFSVKTIFDVGANKGSYYEYLRKYFPRAKYFCFEPNPNVYKLLKKRKSKLLNTFNFGFSDIANSKAKLYDFADDAELKYTQPTSTLASTNQNVISDLHKQKAKSYNIKLDTLDNFCKENKIENIDLLKIDTEGGEYKVLLGAKNLIQNKQIKIIFFEFNEMNVYSKVFLHDFLKLLQNYDFYRLMPNDLVKLDNYRPKTHEIFAFQNIVALDKDIKLH